MDRNQYSLHSLHYNNNTNAFIAKSSIATIANNSNSTITSNNTNTNTCSVGSTGTSSATSFINNSNNFDSSAPHNNNNDTTLGLWQSAGVSAVVRDGSMLSICMWYSEASNTRLATNPALASVLESLIPPSQTMSRGSSTTSSSSSNHSYSKENIDVMNGLLVESALSGHPTSNTSSNSSSSSSSGASINNNTNSFSESESRRVYFSYGYVQARYEQLLAMRSFSTLFENILSTVLVMFTNSTPTIRAKAMKVLAKLVSSDAALLSRDTVREAVTERFNDISISVREEAVKLVGSYVVRGLDVFDSYIDGILVRLRDKGVSVRKTVVHIIREILLNQPDHSRYSEMCLHLLERSSFPKEEDSIRDTIQSTFKTLWFLPTFESSTKRTMSRVVSDDMIVSRSMQQQHQDDEDNEDAIDKSPKQSMTSRSSASSRMGNKATGASTGGPSISEMTVTNHDSHIHSTATQIIEVVSKLLDWSWMVSLIRDMLHGRNLTGDEGHKGVIARKDISEKHCIKIVGCLIEMLLRAEERNDVLLDQLKGTRDISDHIVLIIHAIAIFSEVRKEGKKEFSDIIITAIVCIYDLFYLFCF